jgi:hypothetical protein
MSGAREANATREIACRGRGLAEVVFVIQGIVSQAGMEWLHPDDFTVVARNPGAGLYVVLQAWFAPGGEVRLGIHKHSGADGFEAICRAVEDALSVS